MISYSISCGSGARGAARARVPSQNVVFRFRVAFQTLVHGARPPKTESLVVQVLNHVLVVTLCDTTLCHVSRVTCHVLRAPPALTSDTLFRVCAEPEGPSLNGPGRITFVAAFPRSASGSAYRRPRSRYFEYCVADTHSAHHVHGLTRGPPSGAERVPNAARPTRIPSHAARQTRIPRIPSDGPNPIATTILFYSLSARVAEFERLK